MQLLELGGPTGRVQSTLLQAWNLSCSPLAAVDDWHSVESTAGTHYRNCSE